MYELRVISQFAAAHQLREFVGKCEALHGHNWKVEVYVTGTIFPQSSPCHIHFHLPVVSVQCLTFPDKFPQLMGCGELGYDLQLIHGLPFILSALSIYSSLGFTTLGALAINHNTGASAV